MEIDPEMRIHGSSSRLTTKQNKYMIYSVQITACRYNLYISHKIAINRCSALTNNPRGFLKHAMLETIIISEQTI